MTQGCKKVSGPEPRTHTAIRCKGERKQQQAVLFIHFSKVVLYIFAGTVFFIVGDVFKLLRTRGGFFQSNHSYQMVKG